MTPVIVGAEKNLRTATELLKRPWIWMIGCFLALGLLLSFFAAPGLSFHDGGEFAAAAATVGIPHPPGAPTWTLLASLFVHALGLADQAARGTNLFSAWMGACALAGLFFVTWTWGSRSFPHFSWKHFASGALVSVLVLLHSGAFLGQSFVSEQYTLLLALLFLILALSSSEVSRLFLRFPLFRPGFLGLAWGLSMGNHLSQAALILLAVYWLISDRWRHPEQWKLLRSLKEGLALAAGTLLGLAVYLWVPWRSAQNPVLDTGNVENATRLLWALKREQWTTRPLSEAPKGILEEWFRSYDLLGQLGVLGLGLAVFGIWVLWRRYRFGLGLGLLACVPYGVGLVLGHLRQTGIDGFYVRFYGVSDWHLPLYGVLALAAGLGWMGVLDRLPTGRYRLGLTGVGLLAFSLLAGKSLRSHSMREFQDSQTYQSVVSASLPDNALILLRSDNLLYLLGYGRYVEDQKTGQWVGEENPSLRERLHRQADAGLKWTTESRSSYLNELRNPSSRQAWKNDDLGANDLDRPIYIEFGPDHTRAAEFLIPEGFLFRVQSEASSPEAIREADLRWWERYGQNVPVPRPQEHPHTREAWSLLYQKRGGFFMARGLFAEAVVSFRKALEWTPDHGVAWFYLGGALEAQEKYSEAVDAYRRTIEVAPWYSGPRRYLAALLAQAGQKELALGLLKEELRLNPQDDKARQVLQIVENL